MIMYRPSGSLMHLSTYYSKVLFINIATPLLLVELPAIKYSMFHSLLRVFKSLWTRCVSWRQIMSAFDFLKYSNRSIRLNYCLWASGA